MAKKKYIVVIDYSEDWVVWADNEQDAIDNYTDGDCIRLQMKDFEVDGLPEEYELSEVFSTNG
jgi:hypothetical protein